MDRSVDYDAIAPAYDRRYRDNEYGGIERALHDFAGADTSLRVIEVGCGTGHWLAKLLERGFSVAGLDPSARMLATARQRVPRAELVRGRAERLPWRDAALDRLFCINAFHHFTDKPAFLGEARRVLRPRGQLMTIGLDPHTGLDRWSIYDYFPGTLAIDRQRYPAASQIRDWLAQVGFTRCHTREAQHIPLRLPAGEALARGRLDKSVTSQLSILTDAEYADGIRRIEAAMRQAEAQGETLEAIADLRVYATFGHVD